MTTAIKSNTFILCEFFVGFDSCRICVDIMVSGANLADLYCEIRESSISKVYHQVCCSEFDKTAYSEKHFLLILICGIWRTDFCRLLEQISVAYKFCDKLSCLYYMRLKPQENATSNSLALTKTTHQLGISSRQ